MNVLIVDAGTSSMRGVLMNEEAEVLFQTRKRYHPEFCSAVKVIQNPLVWKKALTEIGTEVQEWAGMNQKSIDAVSLTAQRTSVMLTDQDGNAITDAVMWQDKRNLQLCRELRERNKEIIERSGNTINPVFSGSKIAWLRQEMPEAYDQAEKVLTVSDYLLYQMTGNFRSDRTYASRSHLMNLRTGWWDPVLLEIFDVEENKLCELIEPGEKHGTLTRRFSAETGIPEGISVYSPGGDQQCASLGMGILKEGNLEITSGTGAFIAGITKKLPDIFQGNAILNYGAIPGTYIVEASILTCSAAFDWFCKNFYKEPDGIHYERINREIEDSPPGANGCMLLPFFQGRSTPLWNPEATASFTNVTLSTTRGDMARALLEGIACEIRNNIDVVEAQTGRAEHIFIGGGLSRSHPFNQIQADVYERQLFHYSNSESAALGAWISTAVSAGVCASYEEAFRKARCGDNIIEYEPKEENMAVYREMRSRMNQMYQKIYDKNK